MSLPYAIAMNWYYAINQQRFGPVSSAEFDGLVQTGKVNQDTLVWREGMAGWVRYAEAPRTGGGPSDTAVCAVSGQTYPKSEMIQIHGAWVSAEHRDEYFRRRGTAAPESAGTMAYAGFGRRLLAWLLDVIVGGVIGSFSSVIWSGQLAQLPQYQHAQLSGPQLVQALSVISMMGFTNLAIQVTFIVFFLVRFQATVGMLALRLRLVRPDGSKASIGRIIGRHFASILSAMIFFIGFILGAFDDEGRTLHDRIADTRVVKI